MTELINKIRTTCQRHAHPGVNTGAHALACNILRAIYEYEAHVRQGTDKPDGEEKEGPGGK